jgi:polyhydroxyalkanoate synthesis regulator phasin
VNSKDIDEFYRAHYQEFMLPSQVVVRQIFVERGKHSDEEMKELVNDIIEQLKSEDFCDVAKKYSDESEKCRTYLLTRGTLDRSYENAAFNQDIGKVSVVQTEKGINFVQTLNKLNYNAVPLEKVNESIQSMLEQSKREEVYKEYIKALRKDAEIKNHLIKQDI